MGHLVDKSVGNAGDGCLESVALAQKSDCLDKLYININQLNDQSSVKGAIGPASADVGTLCISFGDLPLSDSASWSHRLVMRRCDTEGA